MRKLSYLLLGLILLAAGCAPTYNTEEEVIQESDETQEDQRMIVPANSLEDDYYRTILPFQPGAARGLVSNQIYNRYDINELEQGLTRHATEVFDPEDHLFQEGQYVSRELLYTWLDRGASEEEIDDMLEDNEELSRSDVQRGLNPPLGVDVDDDEVTTEEQLQAEENNPRILSHILEHNFLVREENGEDNRVELNGVAIAIALRSEYGYSVADGPSYTTTIGDDRLMEFGQETADTVLQRLRNLEGLQDVPILLTLYKENDRGAMVPGNFLAKTVVEPNDMQTGEWESVDEKYVLFPSNEADEDHHEHSEMMAEFTREVEEYFPNYTGVIGKGFYVDDTLNELSINIPIEFHSKQEVIGFTQHLSTIIMDQFPAHFDVEITLESPSQQESVLFRKAGEEEPTYHIYQ
ncbi:CamS family sex pheromone protein [Halalkalibacillus halophilus]|uniref:CamS family sex pheromone protein n=1 Tax=Halalkalibacillus halophilus TaxID=392827 RepID=UPI000484E193|nr:CamS family sex pheromone protein [Halalkalibacillus halophilus]